MAEEQTLRAFFEASRAGDNTMLAKVATHGLSPVTEGTVRGFEVIDVGAERVDAEIVTKALTVRAQVYTPGDQRVSRTLVFTLQRTRAMQGTERDRRWVITSVR